MTDVKLITRNLLVAMTMLGASVSTAVAQSDKPNVGMMRETAGYPQAYNIEADPKEEVSVMHHNTWLVVPYLQLIDQYKESLKIYPNPPAPSLNNIR